MSGFYRIILACFILAVSFVVTTTIVLAHPGNTDSLGCHTCRTNCPDWGLYYGEYHCHEPKYYSPPEIYTPPPSCPLFSYYDSLSDSCKCYSGYVASGDKCISENEYCQNIYGFNSRYNSLSDTCECSYGYVIDGGKCISGNQYCWNQYGYNSSYDSLSKSCECSYGYVFNKTGTECISRDKSCQEQFGYGSEYDSLENSCGCSYGYRFDGDECVLDTSSYKPAPLNIPSLPTLKPTQSPLPKSTPKPSVFSGETQAESPSPTIEPTKQHNPPYNLQTELKLNSRGEEVKILQSALATDKEVYPEGITSGFFGKATEMAVKKFQNKYGLTETGVVDSVTRVKFNEVFGNQTPVESPVTTSEVEDNSKKKGLIQIILQFITSLLRR